MNRGRKGDQNLSGSTGKLSHSQSGPPGAQNLSYFSPDCGPSKPGCCIPGTTCSTPWAGNKCLMERMRKLPHFTREVSSPKCKTLGKISADPLLVLRKETHREKTPLPLQSTPPATSTSIHTSLHAWANRWPSSQLSASQASFPQQQGGSRGMDA